jgi:lipopolysaccharide transport system ATP-binding protein
MSDVAIRVEGLGKRYRIGAARRYDTLRDAIAGRVTSLWQRRAARATGPATSEELWALKDVSFNVQRGEILGVVGRNGAGKSTLLKILSRITEPTRGRARIRGRVASLLEVGVGFHPELTARENIYVNGAILGMKRVEIAQRFDEIVSFAEVERFVDTPVKHFSSGMYMRLAFAVAAHLEPQILLVDEVLAVGDAGFQKKCLGKMRDVGSSGRTILFVSHNLAAVTSLCARAILIDAGRLVRTGSPQDIVHEYLAAFEASGTQSVAERSDRYGDGRLRVTHVTVTDGRGRPCGALRSGEPGAVVMRYRSDHSERLRNVLVNLYLLTPWGERICDFQTDFVSGNFDEIPPDGEFVCRIPRVALQPGSYPFTFRVYSSERCALDIVERAGEVRVEAGDFYGSGREGERGIVFMDHRWECRPASSPADLARPSADMSFVPPL